MISAVAVCVFAFILTPYTNSQHASLPKSKFAASNPTVEVDREAKILKEREDVRKWEDALLRGERLTPDQKEAIIRNLPKQTRQQIRKQQKKIEERKEMLKIAKAEEMSPQSTEEDVSMAEINDYITDVQHKLNKLSEMMTIADNKRKNTPIKPDRYSILSGGI